MNRLSQGLATVVGVASMLALVPPLQAQDGWNPFRERDEVTAQRARRPAPPIPPPLSAMEGPYPQTRAITDARPPGQDSSFGVPYPGSDEASRYGRGPSPTYGTPLPID